MKLQAHKLSTARTSATTPSSTVATTRRASSTAAQPEVPYLLRRAVLLRQGRDQGHHRLPAPARQRRRRPAFIRAVSPPESAASAAGKRSAPTPASATRCSRPSSKGGAAVCSRASLDPLHRVLQIHPTAWNGGRRRNRRAGAADLLAAIGYEPGSTTAKEPRAEPSGRTREFTAWLTKKGEEDEELIDLTQTIALINLLDKGRIGFRRRDAAVDAARGQRARNKHVSSSASRRACCRTANRRIR